MSDILNKILDERKISLECVKGIGADSKPLYAYLLVKKNNVLGFRRALADSDVDLTKFGLVVAHGNSKHPPERLEEEVLKAIKK